MKHSGSKTGSTPRATPRSGGVTPTGQGPAGGVDLTGRSYGAGAALQAASGSPGLPARPGTGPNSLEEASQRLHAEHGERIQQSSAAVGVPAAAAAAVLLAEGQFAPAVVDGRMPIRFEPYVFWQQTGRWLVATHKDQAAEYRAFGEAKAIDPGAAHESLRMGMAQVAGSEAASAGYDSAQTMLAALQESSEAQVTSLFSVIAADTGLRDALSGENWREVAQMRAGPGYGALGYDEVLATCAAVYQRVAHGGDDDEGEDRPKKAARPRRKREA